MIRTTKIVCTLGPAIDSAKKFGFKKGSKIILTGGFGVEHGITNTIRIIEI